MTAPSRHPDDATLFDFAAGELDTQGRAVVQQHLARCAACSAFIAASTAGATALAGVVAPMPEAASNRLRLALDDEWGTLHAGERAPIVATPLVPARSTRVGRERRPRARAWRRRAVPVLAFAVIAALAGVSFTLVDNPASTPRPRDSAPTTTATTATTEGASTSRAGAASEGSSGRIEEQAATATDAAAPTDGGAPATGSPAAATAQAASAELDEQVATGGPVEAPIEYDPATGMPIPVCVAGFDPARIALPGNRSPATVIQGPLGLYVVCG
ncbi:MAG: zf-HC2 domain-containing protein [Thermoleophilia bacterium]|nr:zf-HC2 domain-containing protein [Thermoleophilia bacterium]